MKEKIGFIGLGAMGSPMSQNLLKKNYRLTVCDLIDERVHELVKHGAQAAETPREVAESSDVIITIVQSSPQMRQAVFFPERPSLTWMVEPASRRYSPVSHSSTSPRSSESGPS